MRFLLVALLSVSTLSRASFAESIEWTREPAVQLKNGIYTLRAEANVNSSMEYVLDTSVDYDSYATRRIPNVVSARIQSQTGNQMLVRFETKAAGIQSIFTTLVTITTKRNSAEVRWQLAHGQDDNATVESLNGSWKLLRIDQNTTKVSYVVSLNPNSSVPDWLARTVLENSMKKQVTVLFQKLSH